jgi:RNA polymerase sigma-70 factor (ECF subfamily)
LREHDDAARHQRFEYVFAGVYEPLQRYVRRRADAAVVDDVVAETLLVLWRHLDDVPVDAELAWCYGTARRCLANHRRASGRRDRLVARVRRERPVDAQLSATDPEVTDALARLGAEDREIVRLWAWEQLEPREIAVVLAITPNAASIRLHRAKRRLAERLDAGKNRSPAGHNPVGGHTEQREEGA